MKCPTCTTPDLLMTERLGIEIDYCPQCRGVWLDRGELDKIIERSLRDPAQQAAAPVPQAPPQIQQPYQQPYPQPYNSGHGYRGDHHDEHQNYRGKKSIWKELFD